MHLYKTWSDDYHDLQCQVILNGHLVEVGQDEVKILSLQKYATNINQRKKLYRQMKTVQNNSFNKVKKIFCFELDEESGLNYFF